MSEYVECRWKFCHTLVEATERFCPAHTEEERRAWGQEQLRLVNADRRKARRALEIKMMARAGKLAL